MKTKVAIILAAACAAASALAQLPGKPEDNGLSPVSDTFYINTPDTIFNSSTESIGVAIARNGNVIIGWEDDGDGLTDLEAVWTLFDSTGKLIIPDTEIDSVAPDFAGQTITTHFLSYFRADGKPISGWTSWGPKIKANLYGDGIGMGGTSFDIDKEIVELAPFQETDGGVNAGDFPTVQLLSNAGAPTGILPGVTAEYAERDGDIRVADWDYLSTGNVVIVGESRQDADLVDVYGGTDPAHHAIVRIVSKTGTEVKAEQLVSKEAEKSEEWHGVGVTKNGFAVRWAGADGRAKVRFFDNAGTPTSDNIDLGTLATSDVLAAGGRGDGVGFHGNGNDAFVAVAQGTGTGGAREVWVAVINANGTLRWAKSVSDDLTLVNPDRCDAAIDALGRVAVVYDDSVSTGGIVRQVLGRVFDATGKPIGGTFYISEHELPDPATLESRQPRVAFRNDTIAVAWQSKNSGATEDEVVAARLFVIPVKPGSIESVGLTRIVPDTVVINQGLDKLGNWEPYTSVLGDSTFLIEGNAFADGSTDHQRYVVAFQPAAGGPMKLGEAFFADNGTAYKGEINASRQNGNPGRVAGDKRPGAVNFMTGGETSAHLYDPDFTSDNRWNLGFDRLVDGRYGTVQTFKLDPATLAQTSLSKAQDSANGRLTSGAAANNQITRFGGELAALDNGNFVSVVDDRSQVRDPANITVATIFAPDGSVVKDSWIVDKNDIWSNVAAYKGGFVVRVHGVLFFYNNAGDLQGSVNQSTSGESYDTGRSDGTRIAGHINSPYVFVAGKVTDAPIVRVSAWDARTREFVATAEVSEGGFRGDFDRAVVAVDALNRLVVSWVAKPDGYEAQQVAARVLALDEATKTIKPLTASFFPFINVAPVGGINTFQMSVSMTTKQILVAAKGQINLANKPDQGADSPSEINFYTVFSHPNPQDDPTTPVGGGAPPVLAIGNVDHTGQTVTLSWTGGAGPFLVQGKMDINGAWIDLLTTADHSAKIPLVGGGMFLRVQDGATKTVQLFKAILNGANERPNPVVTPATGVGLLALDGTTATYIVSYSGLTAISTAAHLHGLGGPDEAKGVLFAIDGPLGATAGLFSGVKTGLAAATVTGIQTGQTYFNIHTQGANSGGEIRGQVLAP